MTGKRLSRPTVVTPSSRGRSGGGHAVVAHGHDSPGRCPLHAEIEGVEGEHLRASDVPIAGVTRGDVPSPSHHEGAAVGGEGEHRYGRVRIVVGHGIHDIDKLTGVEDREHPVATGRPELPQARQLKHGNVT